jgi:hypothetical protein
MARESSVNSATTGRAAGGAICPMGSYESLRLAKMHEPSQFPPESPGHMTHRRRKRPGASQDRIGGTLDDPNLTPEETSMLDFIKTFALDEDGAVTVDWVVLTAAIVGLGIAVVSRSACAPRPWRTTLARAARPRAVRPQ